MEARGAAAEFLSSRLSLTSLQRAASRWTAPAARGHFKWEQRGKRRIHQKPNRGEIEACHPWLEAEVEVIGPDVVLLLGATAAKAVLGNSFSVTKQRGEVLESKFSPRTVATFHPSSVLRAGEDRHEAMEAFVADLRVVAGMLGRTG